MSKAYLTAMTRNKLSAPMKRLSEDNRIYGRTLDYGCGNGFDANELGIEKFDPHYDPVMPLGKFATIVSNYVLNVIESDDERREVLRDIESRLVKDGIAYITVRNDKNALKGKTTFGTWQGLIVLDLEIYHKCAGYVTYVLRKGDANCVMTASTL